MSYSQQSNSNLGDLPDVDGTGSLHLGNVTNSGMPGVGDQRVNQSSTGGSDFINSSSNQGPGTAETLASYGGSKPSVGGDSNYGGNSTSSSAPFSSGTNDGGYAYASGNSTSSGVPGSGLHSAGGSGGYAQEGSILNNDRAKTGAGLGAAGAGAGALGGAAYASSRPNDNRSSSYGDNDSPSYGNNNASSLSGDNATKQVGNTTFGTGDNADSYGAQAGEAKSQAQDKLNQKLDERTDKDGFTDLAGDKDAPGPFTGRVKHNKDNDDSPVIETTKQRSERDEQGRELDSYGKPYEL